MSATILGCSALGLAVEPARADILLSQDFDIDPVNYTTTPFFIQDQGANLATRYFNLSNAAGINLNPGITGASGVYIAVQDADVTVGATTYSDANPPTLTFDPISFSLGAGEQLQLSMRLAGLPSVEAVNFIRAQVDLDGSGAWTNVVNFVGGPDNTAYKFGAASLSAAFTSFTYPIPTPTDGVLRLRVQSFNDTNSLNEASGFDNILVDTFVPVPPTPQFGDILPPAKTLFDEPATGSVNYVRGTNAPGTELGFTTLGGIPQGVTDYVGDKQFQVSNAAANFRTELIDLRTTGAVTAGIDLRTYDLTTGFEVADFLRAFVEVSTDGLSFTKINFFDSNGVDGNDNDPLDLLETGAGGVNGPLTHFSLSIPADIATLRFGVDAMNNSTNEFLIWDNLTLTLDQFPGDADGSGTVDFTDLGILLNNYNQAGTFETGDFDDSGTVDFTDLGILLNNYNQSAPTLTLAAPVPEPSSIILAGLGIFGLMCALRRKRVS